MWEAGVVHQLLRPPLICLKKIRTERPARSRSIVANEQGFCDLCGDNNVSSPSISFSTLSREDKEHLHHLMKGVMSSLTIPLLSTLCPCCGRGVCSLLSLGRRVRRMEEELRDKIQTLLNILRRMKDTGRKDIIKREPDYSLVDDKDEEVQSVPAEVSIKREMDLEDNLDEGGSENETLPNCGLEVTDDEEEESNNEENNENVTYSTSKENQDVSASSEKPISDQDAMDTDFEIDIKDSVLMMPTNEMVPIIADVASASASVENNDVKNIKSEKEDSQNRPGEIQHNNDGKSRKRKRGGKERDPPVSESEESGSTLIVQMQSLNNTDQKEEHAHVDSGKGNSDNECESKAVSASPPLNRPERRSKTAALEMMQKHFRPNDSTDEEGSEDETSHFSCTNSESDSYSFAGEEIDYSDYPEVSEEPRMEAEGQDKKAQRRCDTCEKGFTKYVQFYRHIFSLEHKQKVVISMGGDGSVLQDSNLPPNGPPFICPCGKTYEVKKSRDKHYYGQCPLRCRVCNERFWDIEAHRKHFRSVEHKEKAKEVKSKWHEGKSVRRCDLCNIIFKEKRKYLDHLNTLKHRTKVMETEGLPAIPEPQTLTRPDQKKIVPIINRLDELNTDGPPFLCVCENSYDDIRLRNYHFQVTHRLKNQEFCIPCRKKCKGRGGFNFHIQTLDHKKKIMEKERITDASEVQDCLRPKYICDICGKEFHTRLSYRSHNVSHSVGEENEVCKHCGRKFTRKQALLRHLRTHRSSPDNEVVKLNVCDRCGKGFREMYGLNRHIRYVHDSHLIQRHKCQHCDKVFKKLQYLRGHVASFHSSEHGGEGRFHCLTCNEKFTQVKERQLHERSVHKGLENYKCQECGKMFLSPAFLAMHMVKHTGEGLEKYRCPKCKKKFKTSTVFKHHQATVCGDNDEEREAARKKKREAMAKFRAKKLYKCPECGECFAQKPGLISHRKREHAQESSDDD